MKPPFEWSARWLLGMKHRFKTQNGAPLMASLGILKELHVGVSWLVCAIVLPSFWVVVVVLWVLVCTLTGLNQLQLVRS